MAYYNCIAKGYNELYGQEQASKISVIKKNITISRQTKILDVGCGTGISSSFDCFVVGIDPSISLLKQSKNNMKILGAAEFLPFKDGTFDYVISVTSMHNFHDVQKSIAEICRVGKNNFAFSILKKSGKFWLIRKQIEKIFNIRKTAYAENDMIFFCNKA